MVFRKTRDDSAQLYKQDGQYCTFNLSSSTPILTQPSSPSQHTVHTNKRNKPPLLRMTSYYAQYQQLSARTHDAFAWSEARREDLNARLTFYFIYLQDVVPYGITVHHIPRNFGQNREKIWLATYSSQIFMTGLIAMETNPTYCEEQAADEAYTQWVDGYFVDRNWRFFTGLFRIRFCDGYEDAEWERVVDLDPMQNPAEVAQHLQECYDGLFRQ